MFLPLPDDFHAHLRQGELMPGYVRDLVQQFGRAIIMPNTVPAMTSAKAIADYKAQILEAAKAVRADFVPLMTFKLNPNYTEQDLKDMMAVGVVAGKYYPAGVTTNSADGISDFEGIFPVVAMMEKLGLVLCVHGEEPGEFCLDRESAFIKRVETLAEKFPKLKIVFEHLSSAKSVEAVKRLPANVAATFTVHHLMMTLDDIVGDALRPHHFCKPLPKRPEDRAAIREAAFSGNPKFFLGTDSAPHQLGKKECPCGAAGVYSAPVAIPLLVQEFERAGHLDKLPNFIASYGADFYGLPRTTKQIEVVHEKWTVPAIVNGVVPLAAGQELDWKLV
ncbi:dihydroorotase [Fibrobacter sp. UWB5]|uniref:dihydroorotase n=1 Tax=Fibrobacter sp. UWB5 TaxID=1964360 RepID=UPI000B520E76|nr:dihydroorotase [Fibrobacter sp. UWB5]OWV10953.1 dihydroorotase [Fibrobacter sp. UWB5]